MENIKSLLSQLPSVDELLKSQRGIFWLAKHPRRYVLQAIREVMDNIRSDILKGNKISINLALMSDEIDKRLERLSAYNLIPVINATGVVIHTNLGRSILSHYVMKHVSKIACGYSNLEYDLDKGTRGKRYSHVQHLISEITGAENSLIVNNNAAAVLICLNTVAKGKEVIVSRGELVEIGGSFRIPDVMQASGAILKEVGTTNKTHVYDYEKAINENTALLLKVHQSNFKISGFTKSLTIEEMVSIGKKFKLPVMFDLGSGCLIDLKSYGIHIEPAVQEIIKAGVDIVTFSGDKLLGGPQGGMIVGKNELIENISKNPLMRAIRVDKMTLAAFEATIRLYLDEEKAKKEIPTLRMLLDSKVNIKKRAQKIIAKLKKLSVDEYADINIISDFSQSGGGALPEMEFETFAISVKPYNMSVNFLEKRLRSNTPPIIARIKEDRLILDMRTVQDDEILELVNGLVVSLKGSK